MSNDETQNGLAVEEARRQILARHVAGDLSAFAELMTLYRNQIMALIVRSGVPRYAGDDVFQDTFVKLHLAADRYDPTRPLDPWVYTIAHNTIRSYFRALKIRQLVESRESPPEPEPVDSTSTMLDARETARWLELAIGTLPDSQREVVCLCAVKDLSQQDVAEILQIPVNTVKTNLCRARAELARMLVRRNAVARREVSL